MDDMTKKMTVTALVHEIIDQTKSMNTIMDTSITSTSITHTAEDIITIPGEESQTMDPICQKDPQTQNYLVHYGVLGMKWGVRRNRVSSSGKKGKISSIKSKIKKASQKRKKESTKNLSDQELQRRIQRLELEKRYKSLKRGDTNRGSQLAREILEGSARTIGQELVRYGVGTGLNTLTGHTVINGVGKKKKRS